MCDATPQVLSAQVFAADGVTPVPGKGPLVAGSDFTLSYAGAPTCELTLAMLTPAAVIGADQRLIITYRSQLDADSQDGATLTNVAGATEWFDGDSSNPGRVTFTRTLTDGTPGVLDHQDAHTVTVRRPAYLFEKTVMDVTTRCEPGDDGRARATACATGCAFENQSTATLANLSIFDELDALQHAGRVPARNAGARHGAGRRRHEQHERDGRRQGHGRGRRPQHHRRRRARACWSSSRSRSRR